MCVCVWLDTEMMTEDVLYLLRNFGRVSICMCEMAIGIKFLIKNVDELWKDGFVLLFILVIFVNQHVVVALCSIIGQYRCYAV